MKSKFYIFGEFKLNFVLFNIFPPLFLTNFVKIFCLGSDETYILPKDEEYPEQVVFEYEIINSGNISSRGLYCGGTLITYQHVIISSHCFTNFVHICQVIGQRVYSGMVDYSRKKEKNVQTRSVESLTIYPKYLGTDHGDFELVFVTLNSPFDLSCVTRPAFMSYTDPPIGMKCQLIFWRQKYISDSWSQLMVVREGTHQKCDNLHAKQRGIICFSDSANFNNPKSFSKKSNLIHGDVLSGIYCDNLFAGILIRETIPKKQHYQNSTRQFTVLSSMFFRSWAHEAILAQHRNVPVEGLVRSIQWRNSSSSIHLIINTSVLNTIFVAFLLLFV